MKPNRLYSVGLTQVQNDACPSGDRQSQPGVRTLQESNFTSEETPIQVLVNSSPIELLVVTE